MIPLTEFISPPDPSRTKVKFNRNPGDPALRAWDMLLDDDPGWIEMNQWRTKQANNNLDRADYLIALAQYYPYGPDYFVFGGLYSVRRLEPDVLDGVGYELGLLDDYSSYVKRLIVKLNQPLGRNVYNRRFDSLQTQLQPEVYELAPQSKLGTFPGYQNVRLRHRDLSRIIANDEPSWRQALSYVKGVYVITDRSNGKQYVGSASGSTEGLWQRWSAYARLDDLTGGNQELEQIVAVAGRSHIQEHFQYSILEIFDPKTKAETIIEREAHWKRVLDTRVPHGLNWN